MVFSCNKSYNKKITRLKYYNNNLIFGNFTIISISTTFGIDTISHNGTNSFQEFFTDYSGDANDI